jgi:ABC-type iron transport system FetAB permease component
MGEGELVLWAIAIAAMAYTGLLARRTAWPTTAYWRMVRWMLIVGTMVGIAAVVVLAPGWAAAPAALFVVAGMLGGAVEVARGLAAREAKEQDREGV